MLRKLLLISFLAGAISSSHAQFFIPILIPVSSISFECESKNEDAVSHFHDGAYYMKSNTSLSIAHFKEAIRLDSFFCDAYYGLIKAYMKVNNYNKAMIYTELALELNVFQPWLLRQKGILFYRLRQFEQATSYFHQLMELQPREPIWQYYLAESLIKINLLDSAKQVTLNLEYMMTQQEGWNPQRVSYYLLGKIAYYKGRYELALEIFDTIRKEYKRNGDFQYHYALTLIKLNELEKAKKYLKRAKKLEYEFIEEEEIQALQV